MNGSAVNENKPSGCRGVSAEWEAETYASAHDDDDSWTTDSLIELSANGSKLPEYEDQFERVFYNTETDDSQTKLSFISSVFFSLFRRKVQSDFSSDPGMNKIEGALKYTTHVKGLKCDFLMDIEKNAVTDTGVGHKIWREHYFPGISNALFRNYVQETDSQISSINIGESGTVEDCVMTDKVVNPLLEVVHQVRIAVRLESE